MRSKITSCAWAPLLVWGSAPLGPTAFSYFCFFVIFGSSAAFCVAFSNGRPAACSSSPFCKHILWCWLLEPRMPFFNGLVSPSFSERWQMVAMVWGMPRKFSLLVLFFCFVLYKIESFLCVACRIPCYFPPYPGWRFVSVFPRVRILGF